MKGCTDERPKKEEGDAGSKEDRLLVSCFPASSDLKIWVISYFSILLAPTGALMVSMCYYTILSAAATF